MRTFCMAMAVCLLSGGILFAQESLYVQEQSRPLIATVMQVDTLGRTVTVLDTWGKATELYLGNDARVYVSRDSVREFSTIYDLKPGQGVQVSYSGPADKPARLVITILPFRPEWK